MPKIPFFKDTRPWYVRIWHAYLIVIRGQDEDELIEPWYVPTEMPENLNNTRG